MLTLTDLLPKPCCQATRFADLLFIYSSRHFNLLCFCAPPVFCGHLQAHIDILLARDTTANELGVGAVHVSLLDMGGQPEFWQPIGGLLRNNSLITVCGDMREILHNIRKKELIYGDSHLQVRGVAVRP